MALLLCVSVAGCFGGEDTTDEEAHGDDAAAHGSGHDEGGDEEDEEGEHDEGHGSQHASVGDHQADPNTPPTERELLRKTAFTPLTFTLSGRTELTGWLAAPHLQAAATAESHSSGDEDDDEGDDEDEDASPTLPTKRHPLVILIHALNGNYRDWSGLPWRLVDKGYAVLALELRGHGRSRPGGIDWRQFTPQEWPQLPKDVVGILRQIRQADSTASVKGLPEGPLPSPLLDHLAVDPQRITIVGAGLGANVAIKALRQVSQPPEPQKVQGTLLLSATLGYKGLRTVEDAFFIEAPTLLVASQSDVPAYEASQMLYRMLSGEKSLEIYQSIGHGTDMVQFFPELQDKLIAWIEETMPPTPVPVPEGFAPKEENEGDEDDE